MAYVDGSGSATSCRSPVLTGWPAAPAATRTPFAAGVGGSTTQPGGMYYGLPAYHNQHQPEAETDMTSSSRLDFLYDRPSNVCNGPQHPQPPAAYQQQQHQPVPAPAAAAAVMSRQNSRSGNVPVYAQQNGFIRTDADNRDGDIPPPLPNSLPPDCEPSCQPMTSRAMPAPMFQHHHQQPVAMATQPAVVAHSEWNGNNSPASHQMAAQSGFGIPVNGHQHVNGINRSPIQTSNNIDNQMSCLAVSSDRHPPPAPGAAAQMTSRIGTGSRDPTSGGSRPTTRTLPMSYARRLSAPGPGGEMPRGAGNPGARKQWAITPCGFTNARGAPVQQQNNNGGRTTPVNGAPTTQNGQYSPQVTAPRTADGPKLLNQQQQQQHPGNGSQSLQRQRYASQNSFGDDYNQAQRQQQYLQYPNGPAVDQSSIRYKLREGEDQVDDYEQTSIRYTGKANPSKMFRLLQTATGSDTETDVKLAQAALNRQARRRRPTCEEIDDSTERQLGDSSDDIVDISYVGSSIPSRTFRCLQEVLGSRDPRGAASYGLPPSGSYAEPMEPDQTTPYCRNVKVIHLRPAMKKHSSMDNILSDGYTDL